LVQFLTVIRRTLAFLFFAVISLSAAIRCPAQAPAGQATVDSDPAAILRDVLMAACAHNSTDFARSLTVRNAQAFSHLTPAARNTFLKRFVLLDQVGTPNAETGASGELTVHCTTTEMTTEMRIGKPELRDNLAYLSLTLKDAADSSDAAPRRVTMGMVRESGQWKLLSLGLLLLDLPALGDEWERAEITTNESLAIAHLKELAVAIEKYRTTYTHLPDTLAALGTAPGGARNEAAGLVSEELASGRADGYTFRMVIVGATVSGAPAKYELAAIPAEYGRTGLRSFFRESSGALHGADRQGAVGGMLDPKIE
jgi:hypothetical protein